MIVSSVASSVCANRAGSYARIPENIAILSASVHSHFILLSMYTIVWSSIYAVRSGANTVVVGSSFASLYNRCASKSNPSLRHDTVTTNESVCEINASTVASPIGAAVGSTREINTTSFPATNGFMTANHVPSMMDLLFSFLISSRVLGCAKI